MQRVREMWKANDAKKAEKKKQLNYVILEGSLEESICSLKEQIKQPDN